MRTTIKKLVSICLISMFIMTQTATANVCVPTNNNCCPPPGYDQPACIIPGPKEPCCPQPCCPQTQCCPNACPCQQNPCCDPCNTCNPCNSCDTCQCPCGDCPKIEHLCTNKDTPVDLVKICGCEATVSQHSVIEAAFAQKIFSKRLHCGDNIAFVLCSGLYTREGRRLLPAGTQILACVDCIVPPKKLNKNAKISLKFRCIMLPDGRTFPICARIYNTEGMLTESKLMSAGKVTLWTLGLFGVGAGLGAAIAAGTNNVDKAIFAIGMPVGFGVGLITGLVSPGLHYRAKCGEKVLIQLTDNLPLCLN